MQTTRASPKSIRCSNSINSTSRYSQTHASNKRDAFTIQWHAQNKHKLCIQSHAHASRHAKRMHRTSIKQAEAKHVQDKHKTCRMWHTVVCTRQRRNNQTHAQNKYEACRTPTELLSCTCLASDCWRSNLSDVEYIYSIKKLNVCWGTNTVFIPKGIPKRISAVFQSGSQHYVSITWRYNSGVNANCGQTVVKRYPLKSCVFCLLSYRS